MMVSEILKEASVTVTPEVDFAFENIQINSKKIKSRELFCAITGTRQKGSEYIPEALERGAAGVLTDSPEAFESDRVIHVPGLKGVLGKILQQYAGNPSEKLTSIGVTGTNGKTTVAKLTASLLETGGHKVISLGTIENIIDGKKIPTSLTTPDPVELMNLLKQGVDSDCDALVMEASSHALHQGRLDQVYFDRAVFTNLTQDHLDYHQTLQDYFEAKVILFSRHLKADGMAIINLDSDYGPALAGRISQQVFSFTRQTRVEQPEVNLTLENSKLSLDATEITVNYSGSDYTFTSSLLGQVNVENLMCVISLGFSLDYSREKIQSAIADIQVPGRNEIFKLQGGAVCVIDYAHTPDALDRVLESFRPLVLGNLCCVFGCGGDRDTGKRPLMGAAVKKNCDTAIITNDNPRTEDPQKIVENILEGMGSRDSVKVILDRESAIKNALDNLNDSDCLVIAGKGHEDYQIFADGTKYFSDRDVVNEWINGN